MPGLGGTKHGTVIRTPLKLRLPKNSAGLLTGSYNDIEVENVVQYILTAAQIKALYATPFQIVPASTQGYFADITGMTLENVFGTTAFTAGGALQLSYGAGVTIPASATVAATFLNSPAASQIIKVAGALASNLVSAIQNTAVNLTNATQAFATGDGELIVTVYYRNLLLT